MQKLGFKKTARVDGTKYDLVTSWQCCSLMLPLMVQHLAIIFVFAKLCQSSKTQHYPYIILRSFT
jgi:hypothetical protein